jgi:hypothetical protein
LGNTTAICNEHSSFSWGLILMLMHLSNSIVWSAYHFLLVIDPDSAGQMIFDTNEIVLCTVCMKDPMTKDKESIVVGNNYG